MGASNGQSAPSEWDSESSQQASISSNPLAASTLVQLLAPVKLRPFKSAYNVRQGNELRLVCQAQRGYPAAYISWFVGNQLVDEGFLREHSNEYRILQLQNENQLISGAQSETSQSTASDGGADEPQETFGRGASQADRRRIVEINPIPAGRQQMQLTTDGRGHWVEYRDTKDDKYAIESNEQQLRYLKLKLAQLTGLGPQQAGGGVAGGQRPDSLASDGGQMSSMFGQTSISVLVIKSLNLERHSLRYACRATTRANTDEVTTLVRVQGKYQTYLIIERLTFERRERRFMQQPV